VGAGRQAGLYWQSRMGNNHDGIGGNCHRYDVVTMAADGAPVEECLAVDFGIKIHNGEGPYSCSFTAPDGLFAEAAAPAGPQVRALLLTHAHEDHIGALRHALDMGYRLPPIYCTAFTAQMVNKSLHHAGIIEPARRPEIHVMETPQTVQLGAAEVTFLPVDHLPGASALLLRTPDATVFHTGDYKFDATMPLGRRADPALLRKIGRGGVDMVISDSTATGDAAGKTLEADIEANLTRLLADQRGRAVVVGLLGSQLDRLVSLGRAAKANGRALIATGASLCANIAAAESAGLSVQRAIGAPLLTALDGRQITADRAVVVTTGAFAQENAGLTRASQTLPGALYIGADTTVVIPQRAIPPVAANHQAMLERLQRLGATVITAENAPRLGYGALHQSGHAIAADTRLLYSLLKPKGAVIPMHGAPAQIAANAEIARALGIEALSLPCNGMTVRLSRQGATVVAFEEVPRIAAVDTGAVKQLPRARPGEGRRPPPPPVFRYDRLDGSGTRVQAADMAPFAGPSRVPTRGGRSG